MNAAVTQQFSSDLEPFFDDNACSYELCTGILYQGCQSFQRFSVCQEIIDQENFVSFSQKFFGNNDIINSSMGERFYFCGINISGDIFGLCFLCKHNRNIKNFSYNTGNSDSRCLDGQDFRDLLSRKTTLKLFSDFPEQIDVHLMI